MGVKRLFSFMKETGSLRRVKISDEVLQYSRRNKAHPPVIVVDGISIIYMLYEQKRLSCLYGGQLKEYKKHLEFFIEQFKKLGVILVFYFDGVNVLFNIDGWIKKKRDVMKSINNLYNQVENGKANAIKIESAVKPRNIWAVTMFVLEQQGCQIKFSVDECDKEMAIYAKENSCMAILANDTDFIIYDTVKTYRSDGMNLYQMTFNMYDKIKMCKILKLESCELPILASLVGNDYIQLDELKNFHNDVAKWFGRDGLGTFHNVARYIRDLRLKLRNSAVSDQAIKRIAKEVFHNEQRSEQLFKSVEFYNISGPKQNACEEIISKITDNNWRCIVKLFYEELCDGDLFGIIAKSCYQESLSLDDFRPGRIMDIPPATNVIRPLREKLYGLLLFEKPNPKTVEEWVFEGFDSLGKPYHACPKFPSVNHPGLISLCKGNDVDTQWFLIGDIFDIVPARVKNLTGHLLIPALAFRYIKKKIALEESEMTALVVSAVLVRHFSEKELEALKTHNIESRAMRLYNLVTSIYEIILLILKVLRNLIPAEMAVPSNYQDGKLFHSIYQLSCNRNMSKGDILKLSFKNKTNDLTVGEAQVNEIIAFVAK